MSKPTNITSEESAPEMVPDPQISSPSPHSLIITWDVPGLPNGKMHEIFSSYFGKKKEESTVFSNGFLRYYNTCTVEVKSDSCKRSVKTDNRN